MPEDNDLQPHPILRQLENQIREGASLPELSPEEFRATLQEDLRNMIRDSQPPMNLSSLSNFTLEPDRIVFHDTSPVDRINFIFHTTDDNQSDDDLTEVRWSTDRRPRSPLIDAWITEDQIAVHHHANAYISSHDVYRDAFHDMTFPRPPVTELPAEPPLFGDQITSDTFIGFQRAPFDQDDVAIDFLPFLQRLDPDRPFQVIPRPDNHLNDGDLLFSKREDYALLAGTERHFFPRAKINKAMHPGIPGDLLALPSRWSESPFGLDEYLLRSGPIHVSALTNSRLDHLFSEPLAVAHSHRDTFSINYRFRGRDVSIHPKGRHRRVYNWIRSIGIRDPHTKCLFVPCFSDDNYLHNPMASNLLRSHYDPRSARNAHNLYRHSARILVPVDMTAFLHHPDTVTIMRKRHHLLHLQGHTLFFTKTSSGRARLSGIFDRLSGVFYLSLHILRRQGSTFALENGLSSTPSSSSQENSLIPTGNRQPVTPSSMIRHFGELSHLFVDTVDLDIPPRLDPLD